MSTSPQAPPLFARLVDDAAMFPPGNASAYDAISAHLRHRASDIDSYVGPLLVHHSRWDDVVAAHADLGSPPLHVVMIGAHRLPGTAPPPLRVVGFEQLVDHLPLPTAEDDLPLACEVSADDAGLEVLAEVAEAAAAGVAVVGKLRTGGTDAASFPNEATVAAVVTAAVRLGAPMKFTAGLHHAVRFTAADTGFEHHGFLNLLVAVEAALAGVPDAGVVEVLASRDGATLAKTVRGWYDEQVSGVRRTFVSFGCCGVEEPIRDLVALSLTT
ncbi:MAG: hypothetical protein WKF54_10145 [Nocardioidaceae bacterium]